jgi:hypothetical protein
MIIGEAKNGDSSPGYGIIVNSATNQCAGFIRNDSDVGPATFASPTITQNDGLAHLLVLTSTSATNHALYLDGYQVATSSTSAPAPIGATNFTMGRFRRGGTDLWFSGTIYAAWRWNRALTARECRDLARAPFAMLTPRPPRRNSQQGGTDTAVIPDTASLTITTYAPVIATAIVTASPTALAITTYAPVIATAIVTAAPTALATSAFAPVIATAIITASPTALVLTTYAPLIQPTPGTLSLTLTTFAPVIATAIVPDTAALTLTTFAPSIVLGTVVVPDTAALTTTKYAPVIAYSIIPATVALSLTTYAPTIGTSITAVPDTLALILTTYAPLADVGSVVVIPGTRALVITPYAPLVLSFTMYGGLYRHRAELFGTPIEPHFEACFRATAGNVYAQLYDENLTRAVPNSQVSTSSSTLNIQESAAMTLLDTHEYRVQVGKDVGGAGELLDARIIIRLG